MFRAIKQHVTGTYHGKKKAWHESTNCIHQESLTDHKTKGIRKYDGTHVNIASYIADLNMAGTEL